MSSELAIDKQYRDWLTDFKQKVRNAQIKAALKVNTELLMLYWELGADLVVKQANTRWGDRFILQLSKDLRAEFPEMKGFSASNLRYIKQWYLFYANTGAIHQQPVGELEQQLCRQEDSDRSELSLNASVQEALSKIIQIPWGHNIVIITKCKQVDEALYYVQNTLTHNWSHGFRIKLFKRKTKQPHPNPPQREGAVTGDRVWKALSQEAQNICLS